MFGYLVVTGQVPEETMMLFGGITFCIMVLGLILCAVDYIRTKFKK